MIECHFCEYQNPDDAVKCGGCHFDLENARNRVPTSNFLKETDETESGLGPEISAGIFAFIVLISSCVGGYLALNYFFPEYSQGGSVTYIEEIIPIVIIATIPISVGFLLMIFTYKTLVRRFRTGEWYKSITNKYGEETAIKAKEEISHFSAVLRKVFRQVGGESLMLADLKHDSDTRWVAYQKINLGKQWIESSRGSREVVHHLRIKVEAVFDFPAARIKHFRITGGSPNNPRIPWTKNTSDASVEELAKTLAEIIESGPLLEEKLHS